MTSSRLTVLAPLAKAVSVEVEQLYRVDPELVACHAREQGSLQEQTHVERDHEQDVETGEEGARGSDSKLLEEEAAEEPVHGENGGGEFVASAPPKRAERLTGIRQPCTTGTSRCRRGWTQRPTDTKLGGSCSKQGQRLVAKLTTGDNVQQDALEGAEDAREVQRCSDRRADPVRRWGVAGPAEDAAERTSQRVNSRP